MIREIWFCPETSCFVVGEFPDFDGKHSWVLAHEYVSELESRASAAEHNFAALTDENKELTEALYGWMIDHGDRCRICMDRSQSVLKSAGRYDLVNEALRSET